MTTYVETPTVAFDAPAYPTDDLVRLEDDHAASRLRQLVGGGEARGPRAYDDHRGCLARVLRARAVARHFVKITPRAHIAP